MNKEGVTYSRADEVIQEMLKKDELHPERFTTDVIFHPDKVGTLSVRSSMTLNNLLDISRQCSASYKKGEMMGAVLRVIADVQVIFCDSLYAISNLRIQKHKFADGIFQVNSVPESAYCITYANEGQSSMDKVREITHRAAFRMKKSWIPFPPSLKKEASLAHQEVIRRIFLIRGLLFEEDVFDIYLAEIAPIDDPFA